MKVHRLCWAFYLICFSLRSTKEVALLGLGSGETARAILADAELKSLTVAELEPAIILAARQLRRCPFNLDPRLNIKRVDGRNMLSMSDKQYDVIISQPGETMEKFHLNIFIPENSGN